MTDIQPSPPGYRGQDEAPGPISCSPGSFKYAGHAHHPEHKQQQSAGNYVKSTASTYNSKESYACKQSNENQSAAYRRKSENSGGKRSCSSAENEPGLETNNHVVNKKSNIAGYNEGYKKNTPGYKNDSGYSESLGFDSFSLPLNERDDASPPPTPPVRDASSLKGVCYGPGHEKYPSWPSAPERHPDGEPNDDVNGLVGSHRSKSWTDHTNYPKEKPAQYTRPLAKRPNPTFTQQLKTVMERCEKIPAETFESRGTRVNVVEEEPRLWPRVDREGKPLGDAEYVVPSPPEREQQQPSQTISHAELEAYVRSYQDPQVSQVDVYRETALTQAGLEEYTRVQHSQQASYAQSEGYHSYVSSVDSTTNTPFLDRLRRDSEAVAQRPSSTWEEGSSREGRDSVVTTSSGGSASSSETLKWHGSMSDVSVSSGLPVRHQAANDRWDRGSMSDVSSVSGQLTSPGISQKPTNHHEKWQSSMNDLTTSPLNPSSGHSRHSISCNNSNNNKWKQNGSNWQSSMNERNSKDSPGSSPRATLPSVIANRASVVDLNRPSSPPDAKWQESSIDEENLDGGKLSHRNWQSSVSIDAEGYSPTSRVAQESASAFSSSALGPSNLENSNDWSRGSMSDVSQSNPAVNSSKQLIAHSARVQTPQRHHSESVLYLDRERSAQRKLYPIATTKPQDSPTSCQVPPTGSRRSSPISPQQAHLSVAERISELEKAQQTRYTYLDPDKRHRVPDPTLKAIQKKALLSFYERHQQQSSWRSEPQLAQENLAPARSPPPQPPPRPRPPSSRRASSASDYSSGTWREKTSLNRPANCTTEPPVPKHQHSNSCGSLSTDLLGPVIVGPAISIDDWVPERPPKKPHLRGIYNDRVPSPDLPPPSPPNVDETEVLNCDDPLPPPPPELSDTCDSRDPTSGQLDKRHRAGQHTERQSRRSKHPKRTDREVKASRSSPLASSAVSLTGKSRHVDNRCTRQHFVRAGHAKRGETEVNENGSAGTLANHRAGPTGRSSLRYPSAQKLTVNGRLGNSGRDDERLARPPARLPDLVSQRYSDSGNQRPAPQVPVEARIARQESMRLENTSADPASILRTENCQRYESSSGQRPQPQVPITCCNADKSIGTSGLQGSIANNPSNRPGYLALPEANKSCAKYGDNTGNNYSVGSPVKTGYEANSKLMAEASPQKYHEPPKYTAGYHQRHNDNNNQRYCYALAAKYVEQPKQKPQPQCPTDRHGNSTSGSPPPPILAPRQNTPGRKSLPPPPRPAPPHGLQGSQSKASYLAYRRERGAPDSEGSYKRTMSPTARLDDWHHQNSGGSRDHDDPVSLRVTPHNPRQASPTHQTPNFHAQQQNAQPMGSDLPKSHSVDALHQRIEERSSGAHSNDVMNKLSRDLTKKLQSMENRTGRTIESNNNNSCASNNDKDHRRDVDALNARNRQSERERRKMAANSEPPSRLNSSSGEAVARGIEDFYRERSATIEMTSRNVELLNRRNALAERRAAPTPSLNANGDKASSQPITDNPETRVKDKPPPPLSSPPRSPSGHLLAADTSPLRAVLGAVARRSGSSSSSNSNGSSNEEPIANRSSRSSPRSNRKGETSARQEHAKALRDAEQSHPRRQPVPRRKISSPSQTENSWTGTNTPRARSSQTEVTITNASLRRNSSPRSRSSSMSSAASKISTSSSSSSISPRYSPSEDKNSSPCVSPQPGIEGLALVQRSEIVLRVNSTTIDASSQTEAFDEDNDGAKIFVDNDTVALARRKLPEEIACEELSRDLAIQLGPNDKLVPILLPAPEHKKPTDYVSGLFRVEATLQPRPKRPPSLDDFNSGHSADTENEDSRNERMLSTPSTPLSTTDPSSPLSPTSAYFTTSEGKARFLTRYSRDVTDEDISTSGSGDNSARSSATNSTNDSLDLRQKKEELVLRLDKKVLVLRAEQEAVREEGELNEALGTRVSSRVSEVARPAEASKYRLHVEEVGKITSLLLGLSGRLARAENALYGMPAEHPERKILESKRDKLMDQLEEAKILKSNIDKRSVNVSAILSKYLNDEEYADYQHFINMKAKLIMDGREIQDKVKLGEEQLAALKEAID